METDPWYFSKYICGHGEKAVERIHRPLLYLYTRQAELLIATLDAPRFEGEITAQVKADFRAQKPPIDWGDPAQLPRVQQRLKRIQVRAPRRSGKSTMADDADLWEATIDPDTTIGLGTKADRYAIDRITAMGKVVMSDEYAFWFPDRVPKDPKHDVTQDAIFLAGRKTIKTEATIEGRGINSPWTGRHYRKNRRDDIVGTESGDASIEDALQHISQMPYLHDPTQWAGDLYIGTVNGENDDYSVLAEDTGVLSIVMPIERHDFEVNAETVWMAGTPTMPEWEGFDADGIFALKAEAKINPYGTTSLLQNAYMVAHKAGSVVFAPSIIKRGQFLWRYDTRLKRDLIWRPKLGKESTPRDPESDDFHAADWFVLDLKKLPRSAFAWAFDQSVSESGEADEWSGSLTCIDHEGVHYLLDNIADRGYDRMVDAILPFDRKAGFPPRNGFDSDATQGMTINWLQRSADFRSLARRVVRIQSGGLSKEAQILNWLQAPMRSGGFYVNPKLTDWLDEARRYRPRTSSGKKKRRAVDNRLDSARMAMTLVTRPPSPEEIETGELSYLLAQQQASRYEDHASHMDTRSWMGQATNWRAV
jgi:hypothetical protein